jgi:hypothetical protein
MAFTATELQDWVKGLGLPEDKQKSVLESFGAPEVLTRVGESILARSDYSRRMDELKAKETQLQADLTKKIAEEEKKTLDYSTSVGNWKKDKEKVLADAIKAREDTEAKLAAIQTKIKEVAPTYAIPEDQVNSILSVAPPNTDRRDSNVRPRDEEGKYVSQEQFNKTVMDYAKLPAIMTTLEREHLRLFGAEAEMPDWSTIVDEASKNQKSLKQMWEEKYKVPERRAAIAKDIHDKEIAEAEKRGAEAARSKWMAENPTNGPVRRDSDVGSPALATIKRANEDKNGRPDEARGVAAAVAAFQEGRYRPGA